MKAPIVPLAVLVLASVFTPVALTQGVAVSSPDAARIDADLNAALVNRVETAKKSVGIVVGIVTAEGRRYLSRGRIARESANAPDARTMFEIGSMTKVFTALLLADMVERGEVSLDDPISQWLPADMQAPLFGGRPITLVDLATHTSGLPRLPDNLDATKLVNPYASYGTAELRAFLGSYRLTRAPGSQWEYSNLGAGLLGYLLSQRAGVDYEPLLRARILEPLGMRSTTITLSLEQWLRMASGYDLAGAPTPLWDWDAMAGAGAIRSDAEDLLTFASALLGHSQHSLQDAVLRMMSVSRPAASPRMRQQLGLLLIGGTVLFHDGGTGGFRSALALRPDTRQAAVVLSNSAQDVTDIALHAVMPEQPLPMLSADRERTAIELDAALLDDYVGHYRMTPQVAITITREGTRLFAEATGQPRTEWFAETPDVFFDRLLPGDASFRFERDPNGRVTGLRMQIAGAVIQALRE